ncbi:AraC family transcriptional regulator, partial [Bacillus licheniformis]|nr:AraC family transcriptional regulator [Bacillus licheniformis]
QNVWGRIYAEWCTASHYEQTKGPEIIWNQDQDISSPTFKSVIWIPVQKRTACKD